MLYRVYMIHILFLATTPKDAPFLPVLIEQKDIHIKQCRIEASDLDARLYDCDMVIIHATSSRSAIESVHRIRKVAQKPLMVAVDNASSQAAAILDAGADDCVASACSGVELYARCLSLMRRSADPLFFATAVRQGDISLDLRSKDVMIHEKRFPLTKTEYRLLYQLVLHAQRIVPKSKLETCLKNHRGKSAMHRVDMHIMNLRRKTDKEINIQTISCYGLKLRL